MASSSLKSVGKLMTNNAISCPKSKKPISAQPGCVADLFSELDPPLNDLDLWKFRLKQPG